MNKEKNLLLPVGCCIMDHSSIAVQCGGRKNVSPSINAVITCIVQVGLVGDE